MFRKCVVKCKMFIYNKMRLSVTISLHPRRQVATVTRCPASASIMWVLILPELQAADRQSQQGTIHIISDLICFEN